MGTQLTGIVARGIVRITTGAEAPDWCQTWGRAEIDEALGGPVDGEHAVDEVTVAAHDSILTCVVECRCHERATGTVRYSEGRDIVDFITKTTALLGCDLTPRLKRPEVHAQAMAETGPRPPVAAA